MKFALKGNQNCNGDVGISHKPLVEYVVVPSLPRGASVEWQVYTPAERVDTTGEAHFQSVLSAYNRKGCLIIFLLFFNYSFNCSCISFVFDYHTFSLRPSSC